MRLLPGVNGTLLAPIGMVGKMATIVGTPDEKKE